MNTQQDIPDLIAGALGVSRGTAYDLMREALVEQADQVQPVAEKVGRISANVKDMVLRQEVMLYTDDYLPIGTAIYTAPPPRQPLTDEELYKVFPAIASYTEANKGLYRSIARAIEAAHGIKGEA